MVKGLHVEGTHLKVLSSFPSMTWFFCQNMQPKSWHLTGEGHQFLLLNFMRFLLAHFSRPSRCIWMAMAPSSVSATPPIFVSTVNLYSLNSVSLYRLLMIILNSTGRSVKLKGALEFCLQLEANWMLLITTLWDQWFIQFSIHLTLHLTDTLSACLRSFVRDNVKSLTKVETNNIYCSHPPA